MTEISEENFEVYKETFECFCDNKGTTVWLRKLEQLLHCVGYDPTDREMKQYRSMLNTKDPEKMEFGEFIELMKKVEKWSGKPEDQESKLKKAFSYFDTDGSGYLERGEIKRFLCEKGVDDPTDLDVDYILDVADFNNDGRIQLEEFSKILNSFSTKTRKKTQSKNNEQFQ